MSLWEIKSQPTTDNRFGKIVPVEVLAEFDGPLTFTFRDERAALKLAHLLAIGEGVSRYIACETDEVKISDLKNGMISIRSALTGESCWVLDVLADGTVQNAWTTSQIEIPADALPAIGVLLTPELESAQIADTRLAQFAKSGSDGQIAFDGGPVSNHTIEAGFYGKFCQTASELLAEICQSLNVSPPILRVGMSHESSYAVDLKLSGSQTDQDGFFSVIDIHESENNRRVFDYLMSMIADEKPSAEAVVLIKRSQPLRQRYGNVLELVSQNAARVTVRTRSIPAQRTLSGNGAARQLKTVKDLGHPFMFLTVRGRMIGGLVEKSGRSDRGFCIRVEKRDEKAEDFKGWVADDAVPKMLSLKFGDEVEAKLQIQQEVKEQGYTLVDISLVNDGSLHFIQ